MLEINIETMAWWAGGILLVVGGGLTIISMFLKICLPNQILIFSGRERILPDGRTVGYRIQFGGRSLRIPIIETVDSMDMTVMPVPVECTNAYSKGGIPLHIHAIANVKVSNNPDLVGNAVERFLNRGHEEIAQVARETLEGNLRGVVALMTPEQVNEDRLHFADRIAHDVERDLAKLGLQLDTLKIQSVADDVDYLNSIGRKRIAEIIKRAEIAESDAMREAETAEANQDQIAVVSETEANTAIVAKKNELRQIQATLDQNCRSEEERTEAAALEARAVAEQRLQEVRAELERYRLEADEVLPAIASRQARELIAQGKAAPLAENAAAAAMVNDMLAKVWAEGGDAAAQIFLIQQIEMVLSLVSSVPGKLRLDNVQVVDSGDGHSLTTLVNTYPDIIIEFLDRVRTTFGIDVIGTLTGNDKKGEE